MARIRTIKPDATQSETFARLSRDVLLTFALLWTQCDDQGRHRADPRLVKAAIYPLRDDVTAVDLGQELEELEDEGCICRYEDDDGKSYLHVVNWDKHQKIDHPSKSRIPQCEKDIHGGIRETVATDSRDTATVRRLDLGPRTLDLGPRDIDQTEPRTTSRRITAALFDEFWAAYPRRVAKGAARKAWDKAIKTTEPETIIKGAQRYAADPTRDANYTAHPGTWLNSERWGDEATTGSPTGLRPIWEQ